MYNKIASVILNSAKAPGLSDVYVAQPDSLKENLAGKIFILAEIGGKKSEGRKIFDFLVMALNDNYYNDEKILFRGKIEGLKIENIFEAAITKTNKNLVDFLNDEKIRINPAATNITVGVIYEDKLHFTNFGRNRALLLYRRGEEYEIINVEANAAEALEATPNASAGAEVAKTTKLFSSVISGEVPLSSYFIFASEALPEYLSGKEMVNIVTKLPPITAAEQIKNVLAKMNTYVPFLGIIIKNTAGSAGQESKEELEESLSINSSVSSLNYTEQKTEQMLSPAGLISFSKILKGVKRLISKLQPKPDSDRKKYRQTEEKADKTSQPPLDLGQIKSLNLARADSFIIKEKIFFKKKPGWLGESIKKAFQSSLNLLTPDFWTDLAGRLKIWFKNLNLKNRWLFISLGLVVLIFISSLVITNWNKKRQLAETNFNDLVTAIEEKEDSLDSRLLYNNELGSNQDLLEAESLLTSLPHQTKEQQAVYDRLAARLTVASEKIQKIVKVTQSEKVNDLSGLGVNNLVFASGKIYAASGQFIYSLMPNSASSTKLEIKGATNLSHPFLYGSDSLYYADGKQLVQYGLKAGNSNLLSISNLDAAEDINSFKIFSDKLYLYLIAPSKNQIYRYTRNKNSYSTKNERLKEIIDLSSSTDFAIDSKGYIYILKNNGEILKFYDGKKQEYVSIALSPIMTNASKIIVGTKYIYIFEANSKRLAVLYKDDSSDKKGGSLANQYIVGSLNQVKDVTVDEVGKFAYFLDGETVYRISLNQ